ncbi:hypothetical protein [Actinoplanes sp. NBRC 103695]|uniref:PKD domain-containing protein n=1 Tax=Actinoplanes sp. NBRC 103695 TaxID=3032202 RepID=UPI0024A0C7E3|nr:hypothetical protein [Actinoplanes sp. NBRC 103695]GLY97620.1 hypothetical protein Acsp02_48740 [Actinoplanes sp. NBRC 103695]
MRRTLSRLGVTAGVMVAVIAPVATTAFAVAITPPTPRTGKLVQVGPTAEHGFPAWYRDSNNVRLEACVSDDPLCPVLLDEVPDPDAPISYPDNFPGEFFYQLAGSTVTLTNGVNATIGMDLEGAWAREEVIDGDQMVFGRVRIRFAAPEGDRFRITHPYGIDDIVATDRGVNMTEDIGTTPLAFGGAFNSRIGPFLKWDPAVLPAAPAGYIGDPGVDHKIVGSPYNTNFIRIEQLDPASGAVIGQLGFSDLFSVQGRYATNAGVDIDQATYTTDADGTGFVEVFASSEPGQAIEVASNPALGFRGTRLRGQNGRYYGRFPVTGSVPDGATIEVINNSDRPVARKTAKLVDVVRVTNVQYNADNGRLQVAATSSDGDTSPGVLSVDGFGPITGSPFTGVQAPPPSITVRSSGGGSATAAVTGSGHLFLPDRPVAAGTTGNPVVVGQNVQLDGSGSTGEIDSYAWTQVSGPAVTLTNADQATASFVPTAVGTYAFTLVATGPGGVSPPVTVTTQVIGVQAPTADAGVDQTVVRGRAVALDGTRSRAVETYSWRQVSGPAVTLTGATSARPTFTYPVQALPATPGPNAAFVYNNAPVVLELTVRNPAGIATDQIVVRPSADAFIGGITTRYRTGNNEWRISGTNSLLAGQRVQVVLGSTLTGRTIGSAVAVDAAGAWSVRVTGPAPGTIRTVSVVSSTGAIALAAPVTVTN